MRLHMNTLSMACMAALWLLIPGAAQAQGHLARDADAARKSASVKSPIPRMPDGTPDLRGSWKGQGFAVNMLEEHKGGFGISSAGPSVISDPPDGKIPYQPWALKERDRRRQAENAYEDPRAK